MEVQAVWVQGRGGRCAAVVRTLNIILLYIALLLILTLYITVFVARRFCQQYDSSGLTPQPSSFFVPSAFRSGSGGVRSTSRNTSHSHIDIDLDLVK